LRVTDGIFIGGGVPCRFPGDHRCMKGSPGCVGVHIVDVVLKNAYRNALSVISAEDLLVERTTFIGTNGTNPKAGVDLEPDYPQQNFRNISFNDCVSKDNVGGGFTIAFARLNASSNAVSVAVHNLTIDGGHSEGLIISGVRPGVRGTINVSDSLIQNCWGGSGVYDKASDGAPVRISRCRFENDGSHLSAPGMSHVPLDVYGSGDYHGDNRSYDCGGLTFEDVTVIDKFDRPFLTGDVRKPRIVRGVHGNIAVSNPFGCNTSFLSSAQEVDVTVTCSKQLKTDDDDIAPQCAKTRDRCASGSKNMSHPILCCNASDQCVADFATFAWCVPKPQPAPDRSDAYAVLWNNPWPAECRQHDGGAGSPPDIDWTAVGVQINDDAAFNGEVIVDLYRTGVFPQFLGNGTAVNGGLPQSPDFSLATHLAALTVIIGEDVPSEDFRGVAVLDFEAWYPQWAWHGPPHLPAGDMYWNESLKLAAIDNPSLKGKPLLAAAKAAWLTGAQAVMIASIKHAKKMRPNGVWGYYDAMLPPDDCVTSTSAANVQTSVNPCRAANDELPDLWGAVDAIMPSIYLLHNDSASNQGGIDSKVAEAMRLAVNAGKRRADHTAPLVMPFACPTYGHWLDGSGVDKEWQHWLDSADAKNEVARPAEWGAAGIVVWGGSIGTYRKKTCEAGRVAFDTVLSPVLKAVAAKTTACAKATCSGHGRCATLPTVACICDAGWNGTSCQNRRSDIRRTLGLKLDDTVPSVTPLGMKDTKEWTFSGGEWEQAAPVNGSRAWMSALAAAETGNLAVYTKRAFGACNISMVFMHSWTWTTAALVIGARNSSSGYFVVDVPIEAQQFRTENTFVTVSRVNAAGWREGLAFIGPIPGSSSTVGLEHFLRAELSAEGVISLWLDRQPLGSTVLPGLELPTHVGLATYSMLGKPGPNSPGGKIGMGQFADVVVHGEVASPCFDIKPQPVRNWVAILPGTKGGLPYTELVGNAVMLPDKSVLVINDGTLYRSVDKGWHWTLVPTKKGGAAETAGNRRWGFNGVDGQLFAAENGSLWVIGTVPNVNSPGSVLMRALSTDQGQSFALPQHAGRLDVPPALGASADFKYQGPISLTPLKSRPGTVLLCGGGFTPDDRPAVPTCVQDLSGRPPARGCGTGYLGVSKTAGKPIVNMNYCMRSTDSGASFEGPVDVNGYSGVTAPITSAMLSKDVCEMAVAETAEGEVIALVRPCFAHSPVMWTSRSNDGGASFAPLSRGHFPNYANFWSFTRVTNGALVICGRFPAVTCQFSADNGFTWRAFGVDLSAAACQGSLIEIEPNLLLYVYGGWGVDGIGPSNKAQFQSHSQLMRVTATGLEPVPFATQPETPLKLDDTSVKEAPPATVYGLNGTIVYTLYAETFPGRCWGERINNAITAAISHGGGSADILLPPGDLNMSVPIRLWSQLKTAQKDTTCTETKHTRSLADVWACTRGGTAADLPNGLTLRGIGGTTGNVFEGGTRLVWTGLPDNVMMEMPASWHCRVQRLALHGSWVKGVTGIRYRAGWDFGTNGGKENLFEDLVFEGLETGMQIGDPLSPDLVNTIIQRVNCYGSRQCFLLYGANVAEIKLRDLGLSHFQRAGFLIIGTSGRKIRTREQRKASPAVPMRNSCQNIDVCQNTPTVLTDVDEATEICWEDLPPYAQQRGPSIERKAEGPSGGAMAGGGGPTLTISDVTTTSSFCASWLVDSNGPPLRLSHVRNEGCNGLYRNNGTSGGSSTRTRFGNLMQDVSTCSAGGAADGNLVTFNSAGPLVIIGGAFHGPFATKERAVVFNIGANLADWNKTSTGCVLYGDEWMLQANSPYMITDEPCTSGAVWTSGDAPGRTIKAPVPTQRHPAAFVGFTSIGNDSSFLGPSVHSMQNAYSGTVAVPPAATAVNVSLLHAMATWGRNRYQVFLTASWNSGTVWVSQRSSREFSVEIERGPPKGGELDWEVRAPPWAGAPGVGNGPPTSALSAFGVEL
jgi:hyaluronoglucosaminidase